MTRDQRLIINLRSLKRIQRFCSPCERLRDLCCELSGRIERLKGEGDHGDTEGSKTRLEGVTHVVLESGSERRYSFLCRVDSVSRRSSATRTLPFITENRAGRRGRTVSLLAIRVVRLIISIADLVFVTEAVETANACQRSSTDQDQECTSKVSLPVQFGLDSSA